VDYDLLVIVPTIMGSDAIARSGLGDDLNFVPVDPYTLQSKQYENSNLQSRFGGTLRIGNPV